MSDTSGAYNRKLYLDAIDAARALAGRPPVRTNRTLEALAMRHIEQFEKLMRQFSRRIRKECRADEHWLPDADFVRAMTAVGERIDVAWKNMRAARAEERQAYKDLSEQQMDEVFVAHLLRIAHEMPVEHRRVMLAQWFGRDAADALLKVEVPK